MAGKSPSDGPSLKLGIISETTSLLSHKIEDATLSAREESIKVAQDAKQITVAVSPAAQFRHLTPSQQVVQGLQRWDEAEWVRCLGKYPDKAGSFLGKFLPGAFLEQSTAKDVAKQCVGRMSESMSFDDWAEVAQFQNYCLNMDAGRSGDDLYLSPELVSQYMADRDFPLGTDNGLSVEPWSFAVAHSGEHFLQYQRNRVVTLLVIAVLVSILVFSIIYTAGLMARGDLWNLESTSGFPYDTEAIDLRTKERGTVASMLVAFTFALSVNSSLDKFGLIEPSTSTVFVGMLLGGTFGFMLDNQLGGDEGFREYLWSPASGMKFALGALASDRYARYLLTIIFDMYFTVILFKLSYSKLVRMAGFAENGREYIANGLVSSAISILTYHVYANSTRFEWAYPSGEEDENKEWISGSTMALAVVIMNMVYLVTETRVKVGEPGINDPNVKVLVTLVTFLLIWQLRDGTILDPKAAITKSNVTADQSNYNLPLPGVCATQANWRAGAALFSLIAIGSLGFVIFVTSRQSLAALLEDCGCGCCTSKPTPSVPPEARLSHASRRQLWLGKCVLFALYVLICLLIMVFFTFTPIFSAGKERDTTGWGEACEEDNKLALAKLGLS